MKKWTVPELDKNMVRKLKTDFDLPFFTSMLLTLRNLTEKEKIEKFFNSDELIDPLTIKDMEKAVKRIKYAVTHMEKICVYGDYDCDGVTSTAIMYSYLQSVFAQVMYYIPDRNTEGYGMNKGAVERLNEENVKLILTVDNGITAIEEIDYANSLGMNVVVTDHHKPLDILPRAEAVVDPHRSDETAQYRDYSGAGLALMLCIALENDTQSIIENYSDLASMGTVADIVPLTGDNRTIVKAGLPNIEYSDRIGIAALLEDSGTDKVTTGTVGFRLAPRVNAAGRLGSSYDALKLFLTEDEFTAEKKAELLGELNSQRQQIELNIFNQILDKFSEDPQLTYNRVIVVSSKGWNAGVVGIVSSKITERYGKPSIIISEDGDICKASGRSVEGFSLVDAIFACSDLLEKYGGHPMAVGFSIKQENIEKFTKAINDYANQLEYMPLLSLKLDCNLNPETLSIEMVHQLKAFEPFGCENPKPVFGLKEMHLDKITPVGNGAHLKLSVSKGKARINIMRFSTTPEQFPYEEGDVLDFAVNLESNQYQGKEYLSFHVQDTHLSDFDTEFAMHCIQDYELYKSGIVPKSIKGNCPDHKDFAAVYRYIAGNPKDMYSIDAFYKKACNPSMSIFSMLMILDILKELHHIEYRRDSDILYISLPKVKVKVSLDTSYTYQKLKGDAKNA